MKVRIAVSGHANAAELGKDVVCAGASTVTTMIAQHVRTLSDQCPQLFEGRPEIVLRKGEALVEFKAANEQAYKLLRHDMVVLGVGYYLLGYNYNDRVKVTARGDLLSIKGA